MRRTYLPHPSLPQVADHCTGIAPRRPLLPGAHAHCSCRRAAALLLLPRPVSTGAQAARSRALSPPAGKSGPACASALQVAMLAR
jgi:hypothetical protein